MGKLPYPLHFFFCNNWEKSQETMQENVKLLIEANSFAGEKRELMGLSWISTAGCGCRFRQGIGM